MYACVCMYSMMYVYDGRSPSMWGIWCMYVQKKNTQTKKQEKHFKKKS